MNPARLTPRLRRGGSLTCCLLVAAAALPAQAATGRSHRLLQNGTTPGALSQSSSYELTASFGAAATAPSTSPNYVLTPGFPGVLDTPPGSSPWLTAVRQGQVSLRSQATIQLDGADLAVGVGATVSVGGIPATVLRRDADRITVTLPMQPAPGNLPVRFGSTGGTTEAPRGVAVLPILETDPPAAPGKRFDLVFRGTRGDEVLWVLGIAEGPPILLPGALYGLVVQPPTLLVFAGFLVTRADGVLRLSIPPQNYPTGGIFVQGLLRTANPGYAPAAFTNVLRL